MHPLVQVLVAVLVLVAGTYDILYRRIPNWLVLPCWLVGFAVNAALTGWMGLKTAAFGFGLAMLVYFPLYMLRGMGAGDVKLMAAIGALVGPVAWFLIFLSSSIVGGVVALVIMLTFKRFRKTLRNLALILWDLMHFRAPYHRDEELSVDSPKAFRLPHGAVIALGVIVFLGALPFLKVP
jgi:prepilin peptidase CpaA